ncbi:MAG: T9SS type A sorting domain-containing protein [Bacteroidetes bacterium]|nr:T9SS type A sorting domain-containing protein [Bacteroidota bacterium]
MKTQFQKVLVALMGFLILSLTQLLAQASLEGYTGCMGGPPFVGTIVTCGSYADTTDINGNYSISGIPGGTYTVYFNIPGFPPASAPVILVDGETTVLDFIINCGNFSVVPLNLEVVLEPNATETEILTLSNTGAAPVQWSAEVDILTGNSSEDFFDLIFQVPLDGTAMEKGVACDDDYIYTTDPFGSIRRYAMDGTFIELLALGGYDDLAWDGYYFYGCDGSSNITQLDLGAQAVVSTFTAPGNVSTLAYNPIDDVFYGTSWNEDLMVFDASGALINSAPLPPDNPVYTGLAFDECSPDGPFLWAYGSVGAQTHIIHLYQIPSLQLASFTANMNEILNGPLNNGSGGLFVSTNVVDGICALGGIVQGEWMWTVELAEVWEWLTIEPTSGTVNPGETEEVEVHFDATGLLQWAYQAEINFSTIPNVASPTVDVEMTIEGQPGMAWLETDQTCTDIDLVWETIPPGFLADSFHIYKDSVYYVTAYDFQFTDSMQMPGEFHDYYVTGYFFNGWESNATNVENVFLGAPEDLVPSDISLTFPPADSIICFNWTTGACIAPEYFKIYKDYNLIAETTSNSYCDTLFSPGYYEYYITAQYYFGESDPCESFYFIWEETSIGETNQIKPHVFPNPAKDEISISSNVAVSSITIYDFSGIVQLSHKFTHKTIDVSDLNPGCYFLVLETEKGRSFQKLVIK